MIISFDTDNAAFEDENLTVEIIRILHQIADKVSLHISGSNIRDINGNQIGNWRL